jgi:hypothetical protein
MFTQTFALMSASLLVAVTLTATGEAAQSTTVKQVMVNLTIPGSDAIFDAATDPPKTAEQWEAVRKGATTLVESGQLLQTADLAKDNNAWMEMAREMVTQAQATLKVVDAKDAGALGDVGDRVYVTCDTCHKRYMDQ